MHINRNPQIRIKHSVGLWFFFSGGGWGEGGRERRKSLISASKIQSRWMIECKSASENLFDAWIRPTYWVEYYFWAHNSNRSLFILKLGKKKKNDDRENQLPAHNALIFAKDNKGSFIRVTQTGLEHTTAGDIECLWEARGTVEIPIGVASQG